MRPVLAVRMRGPGLAGSVATLAVAVRLEGPDLRSFARAVRFAPRQCTACLNKACRRLAEHLVRIRGAPHPLTISAQKAVAAACASSWSRMGCRNPRASPRSIRALSAAYWERWHWAVLVSEPAHARCTERADCGTRGARVVVRHRRTSDVGPGETRNGSSSSTRQPSMRSGVPPRHTPSTAARRSRKDVAWRQVAVRSDGLNAAVPAAACAATAASGSSRTATDCAARREMSAVLLLGGWRAAP